MNKETEEELAAAEQVKRALQNSQKGIGLYGAETIEKLIARIRCQDRKIERYESGDPSPVIREHIESLHRTIAAQSEKIESMRNVIERMRRETPEQRMKEQICFRSVSGEQPEERI